ncbi:choice-of-anchor E domain-containing protein [Aromatoleum anaerobium]|uniref:Choice-of-anchor E domain-containing protein n=1 Tax=Aromatoleum anaerobium TaxID=182180 RepID=A0ABX1PH04_9RHOO|nr:choice-of-anchor E domain-containing protein [Aromatoleum anaerobium]
MQTQLRTSGIAIASLFAAIVPSAAHALLMTDTVTFGDSASVTDTEGGGATTVSGASFGTSELAQFDASAGVLTGATLNLTSTRTQTVTVSSTDGPNSGSNPSVTTTGTGQSTARIVAPGVNNTFSPAISGSDGCTDNRKGACSGAGTTSSAATNLTATISSADLGSYVGGGTIDVSRSAPTLSATQTTNFFTGTETTSYGVTWAGEVGVTYDYLLHAAPGLTALTLDFGTLFLDETASLSFDILNLAGDRVGLDLDGFDPFSGPFSSDLATFAGLEAGGLLGYTAMMDTSAEGTFSSTYRLFFSDADVGVAATRSAYALDLTFKGIVVARPSDIGPTAVPEPDLLALLGIGLAALAFTDRRKARQK